MKTYAIFSLALDAEIWVTLKEGDIDSIPSIRDEIISQCVADPSLDKGFVEQYPFYMAEWEMVGGRMDNDFDFSQIIEVNK